MEKFINMRPPTAGDTPLFVHARGIPMTGAWFRNKLSECCKEAGIKKIIKGHSIRIGAASEAVNQGIPFHIIQSMGRWKSDCAKRYIRLTGSSMANFRMALTNIWFSFTPGPSGFINRWPSISQVGKTHQEKDGQQYRHSRERKETKEWTELLTISTTGTFLNYKNVR